MSMNPMPVDSFTSEIERGESEFGLNEKEVLEERWPDHGNEGGALTRLGFVP